MTHESSPWERLFTLSPDLVCVANTNGYFERVNPAFKTLGYSEEELLSRPFRDFVHPDDRAASAAEVQQLKGGRTTTNYESRFRCKDGSYRWLSWTTAPDPSGKLYAIGRDVTEERNRRELLQQTHLFLDAVVENIPNMVFVKGAQRLEFVRFNRAGETLLGLSRESLLGKNDYDFFPAAEADFFQKKDRETLEAGKMVDIAEERIQTANGERLLHTRKVPILDESGKPQYLLGISEDITEKKAAVEALLRAKEATDAANRELEAFSYSVAHDLRAPLRTIDGFSQALLEDYAQHVDATGQRYLGHIRTAAQLMGQLIDDLLSLSRVSRAELSFEPVRLSDLVRATVAHLRLTEPDRVVDIAVQDEVIGHGDRRLLAVVVDNLIGNAWKFTSKREDGRIQFGATDQGKDETVYFVRDNGAGFDQTYAHKLFGVFQRLHSNSDFQGTGVGLAIVHRIVHRLGGRVWAEGTLNQGATFFFSLPQRGDR
jgi:PAS domain S-box-containing protein